MCAARRSAVVPRGFVGRVDTVTLFLAAIILSFSHSHCEFSVVFGSRRGAVASGLRRHVPWFGSRIAADAAVGAQLAFRHVCVGHDPPAPGSGIGIETSTASGSAWGASSGRNRRYPTPPLSPASVCGGSPHIGQAVRNADAAGVNRIRQPGQHAWVMSDPVGAEELASAQRGRQSRSALARQFASATWAGTVHHRIVECRVTGLEIHPVAPPAEYPQDVSAFTVILTTSIDDSLDRARFGRRNQGSAGHWVTASPLLAARRATCRLARDFCVAVAMADRLSALLAEKRRPGSEKSWAL